MNGYYIYKNGTRCEYGLTPEYEKVLFKDAISDRINTHEEFCGAEIGVLNGETSAFFLNEFENLKLIGIDPIVPDSMESSLIGNLEIISNNTKAHLHRWTFWQDYSFNVHLKINDLSLGFVFIDGDHTYDAVKQDYDLYFSKVKQGGLIFLHDSRMFRGGANFHIGSSKFTDEIIANDSRIELIGEAFSLTCFLKK